MSWADRSIEELALNQLSMCKPHGGSMRPKIESGASVTLEPLTISELATGDIVLCKVKGSVLLHLVLAVDGGRVQIGNNHGKINGWTRTVYGRVIHVEQP